jgi:DNA-binding transcriptional LysR family regulator
MCTINEGNRPMDHLQAIRIFARVVETGSFTRAALSLDMPNTTVSKWVRSLEAHLGVKLLERSTRRVTVTTDGAAYYERTRFLLSELDDVEATLGRAHGSPRGALRIDTGGSVASNILIPALPSFRATYPDIQLLLSVTDRLRRPQHGERPGARYTARGHTALGDRRQSLLSRDARHAVSSTADRR